MFGCLPACVPCRDLTPWLQQFSVLLRRSFKEQWRKRTITYLLLLQVRKREVEQRLCLFGL